MRALVLLLAALLLWMLGVNSAAAQSPLDCTVVPQNICEDAEILALEGERSALVEQLTTLDAAHPALANEQIWLDGLGACGDDAACYRTAYLNHNQLLRSATAPPTAPAADTAVEEPPDAASVEEAQSAPERAAPQTRTRREPRQRSGDVYVSANPFGWGFFTAIGLSLLIFYALTRALRNNRRELREYEAQLREVDWG